MDSGMCENECYDFMQTARFESQDKADQYLRECKSKCQNQMSGDDWDNSTTGTKDGTWD